MAMFRVHPEERFTGPHQDAEIYTYGAEPSEATVAMILIHGRGASAQSMFTLADDFDAGHVHYIAPQAGGHTWYPYSFLAPKDRNQPGLSSGLQLLHDLVEDCGNKGFEQSKVILLGFSQGACLTLEFAARHPVRFGGIAGLSGGLIGPEIDFGAYEGDLQGTPVFLGCSDRDPHIPKERVDETEEVLKRLNADVTKRIYPGMPHTVIADEIDHVREMIRTLSGPHPG